MPDDEFVVLRFEGIFVDILCEGMPELLGDVVYEHGKKVLYVRALKAIYGCVKSALLWYNLYESTLVKQGFVVNPYGRCVANKMINGKQCTIAWYVDDNIVGHAEEKVLDELFETVESHFCLLYTSPSPRDKRQSRMPSSA